MFETGGISAPSMTERAAVIGRTVSGLPVGSFDNFRRRAGSIHGRRETSDCVSLRIPDTVRRIDGRANNPAPRTAKISTTVVVRSNENRFEVIEINCSLSPKYRSGLSSERYYSLWVQCNDPRRVWSKYLAGGPNDPRIDDSTLPQTCRRQAHCGFPPPRSR